MKLFKSSDVENFGNHNKIYVNPEKDLIYKPLYFHKAGKTKTATGYGRDMETPYLIMFNNRTYRIYSTCYSNAASCYIKTNKGIIYID